jgi:hypothetical protein
MTVTPATRPNWQERKTIAENTAMSGEIRTSAQILKTKPAAIPTNALASISNKAIVKFNSSKSKPNLQLAFARFTGSNKTALLTCCEQRFKSRTRGTMIRHSGCAPRDRKIEKAGSWIRPFECR